MNPKIAFLDIETAPSLGAYFDRWKEGNIVWTKADWYILCFSYQWLGKNRVYATALPPGHKEDDSRLVKELWKVFNEADILIAHNGDAFDIKKSNARFVFHGLEPPSPYQTIDTLKIARKHFKFDSNKLDHLGAYLGIGRKLPNTGAHLWRACMAGDRRSLELLKRYCAQDVRLLHRVYDKLKPWASNHPNLGFFTRDLAACPVCQSKNTTRDGYKMFRSGKKQRMHCGGCGHKFVTGKHIRVD